MGEKISKLATTVGMMLLVWVALLNTGCGNKRANHGEEEQTVNLLYGLPSDPFNIIDSEVNNGQTLSTLLGGYGVGASRVDQISKASDGVFDLRNMRAGNKYTLFLTKDTLQSPVYFVYQESRVDYIIVNLSSDSVVVTRHKKDVTTKRMRRSAEITSSLWNCMIDNGMPASMVMDLSDIYAYTVDFFGIREGDNFTVVYDEMFVDTVSLGVGRIWGAVFNHAGKKYYAIPFKQGDKISYWDENGNSLRRNLLKSPLKFSRISSKFSNSRLHPVLKIRRPHHGVDYAAPSGTPVHSVADGTVLTVGYLGGGGNTVKIKHASGLMSGYLHLRGYAKGLRTGKRVAQGELIGYVGSTGLSTGAHLDFRLWRNGKAIDPLKVPSEPTEPITKANRVDFDFVKERILAEVNGTLANDSLRIMQLDSVKRN